MTRRIIPLKAVTHVGQTGRKLKLDCTPRFDLDFVAYAIRVLLLVLTSGPDGILGQCA